MTYEEIITSIYQGEYQPYANQLVDNAIVNVLEKQIPKKPIIKRMIKHISAHCSICDTDITYYSSEENYCHKCGQAIKWE